MRISAALLAAAVLATLQPIHAQNTGVYKVEINIHDGNDAAARTGRRYIMLTDESQKATFRVGNRVPVVTGSVQPGSGAAVNTQYTYMDTGVNIDCTLRESAGKVGLRGSLDLSTVVLHDPTAGAATAPAPTVAQVRLDLQATIDMGKPTIVASIDDPVTARKLQVEATVTKVN